MKHNAFLVLSVFLLSFVGCKSNPNKAEKIDTTMQQSERVSGSQAVGVKKDEMVVMDKVQMSEKLRDLQNKVYSLEDQVYGTRKLGSLGLYGELKSCQRKLASRQFGGSGTMVWSEPLDRVTDKEDELKMGLDEKKNLVGVSEEFLIARVQRFTGYKTILQKRADDFQDRIETCKSQLATKEMDSSQPTKVMVEQGSKSMQDHAQINSFMCSNAKAGASLQALMLNLFARGWLSLSDFKMDQTLLAPSLTDSKGVKREHGLLFNGWKLAYDRGQLTVGEVFNDGKDAKLVAWTFEHKSEIPEASKCLPAADGAWNL